MSEKSATEFSVEFWERPTRDGAWRHRAVGASKYFIDGALVGAYDVAAVYDEAYAVSAPGVIVPVTKPRASFAEMLAANSVRDPT